MLVVIIINNLLILILVLLNSDTADNAMKLSPTWWITCDYCFGGSV